MLILRVAITDDRKSAARQFIEDFREFGTEEAMTVDDVLRTPYTLIGTEDEIVEAIHQLRESYDISYLSIFAGNMEEFAPIIARLAGS